MSRTHTHQCCAPATTPVFAKTLSDLLKPELEHIAALCDLDSSGNVDNFHKMIEPYLHANVRNLISDFLPYSKTVSP